MEIGNVKLLEIRLGKIQDSKDYGVTFFFHNQNNFQVKINLFFSKHIFRSGDGTYSKDITPKMESIRIPANEKIKSSIKLGNSFPTSEYDLRLQDIFLEIISIEHLNGNISENVHIQVYSKEKISKVSTLTKRKIF